MTIGGYDDKKTAQRVAENLAPKKINPRRKKHTRKFDRCVRDVKRSRSAVDPYAVCQAELGRKAYVANPYATDQADVDKAYKLYKEFREEIPKRGRVVEFETPKVVMVMGNINAIEYDTTQRGKVAKYRHHFAAGSRPLLCADGASGQLFIVEGRYRVTKRGIVDIDARGEELD